MAYIGNKPSQTLASPTSQYFNGTGSQTVFTLNRLVNVSEDLEVFVNNIQQEPGVGKSYTATGSTLTFDAAPSAGTSNVYVVYRGLAEVTTRLETDPNSAISATTGTFSGGIDVTGGVTSDGLTVDGDATLGGAGDTVLFNTNSNVSPTYFSRSNVTDQSLAIGIDDNDVFLNSIQDEQYGGFEFQATYDGTGTQSRLSIANNGDISFYDNTGVTQGFLWDASTQRLGLGTTSPSTLMHLSAASPRITLTDTDTGADHRINADSGAGNLAFDVDVNSDTASPSAVFNIKGTERLRINSTGVNVTGNATFADNGKAIFGAGSDLQIYHDGSNSYIDDAVTGHLNIRASRINFQKYTGETMAEFIADGATSLRHNNATKLATTSTGVNVTGNIDFSGGILRSNSSVQFVMDADNNGGEVFAWGHNASNATTNELMRLTSAGSLGIGTVPNAASKLHVSGGRSYFASNSNPYATYLRYNDSTAGVFVGSPSANAFQVSTSSGASRLNIDSSGNATFSGSVTATGGFVGAGGLLQVVQTTTESEKSTTSTGFVASGIFVDITPSSTSSKILVTTGFTMGTSPNGPPEYKLYRSGTALTNARMSFQADANWNNTTDRGTIEVLDSPNSTASRRYEIYFKRNGTGAARIGRSGDKSHATTSTYITAMEIAG